MLLSTSTYAQWGTALYDTSAATFVPRVLSEKQSICTVLSIFNFKKLEFLKTTFALVWLVVFFLRLAFSGSRSQEGRLVERRKCWTQWVSLPLGDRLKCLKNTSYVLLVCVSVSTNLSKFFEKCRDRKMSYFSGLQISLYLDFTLNIFIAE